jgi:hypothetical protein
MFHVKYKMSIDESIKLSNEIEKIFKKYGLEIPTESKIQSISLTKDPGSFAVSRGDNGFITNKIGRFIKELFPDVDVVGDKNIEKMISELKLLSNSNEKKDERITFKVYDSITYWYKKLDIDCGISSCVNNDAKTGKVLADMDMNDDIKIIIAYDNEKQKEVGRALLWLNVDGIDASYMDRTYPIYDMPLNAMFKQFAEEQGYYYRDGQGYSEYKIISGEKRILSFSMGSIDNLMALPYLDTFRYGYLNGFNDLILTNDYNVYSSVSGDSFEFNESNGIYFHPEEDGMGKCQECNSFYPEDTLTLVNDSGNQMLICQDCFQEGKYEYCSSCGTPVPESETATVYKSNGEEETYCSDCLGDCSSCGTCAIYEDGTPPPGITDINGDYYCHYRGHDMSLRQCQRCGEYDIMDHMYQTGEGLWYCKNHLPSGYEICLTCELWFDVNDMVWVSEDGGYYCEQHAPEEKEEEQIEENIKIYIEGMKSWI